MNGVEITIQNGPTVEVGERVSIVCSCNIFSECPNEVHFEIRGVKYNFTTLKNGGVPGYRFTPDEDSSSFIVNHKLILVSATIDDSGTTYRCIPSVPDVHVTEWSNRETLTVRGKGRLYSMSLLLDGIIMHTVNTIVCNTYNV